MHKKNKENKPTQQFQKKSRLNYYTPTKANNNNIPKLSPKIESKDNSRILSTLASNILHPKK